MTCLHGNLTALPSAGTITRQLRSIDLSHNHIIINRESFQGFHWLGKTQGPTEKKKGYKFTHHEVPSELESIVDLRIFVFINILGKLVLSHNGLTDLPTGVFKDLRNLLELDLSFNQLYFIEKGTVSNYVDIKLLFRPDTLNRVVDTK